MEYYICWYQSEVGQFVMFASLVNLLGSSDSSSSLRLQIIWGNKYMIVCCWVGLGKTHCLGSIIYFAGLCLGSLFATHILSGCARRYVLASCARRCDVWAILVDVFWQTMLAFVSSSKERIMVYGYLFRLNLCLMSFKKIDCMKY